jgi:hypothetical protein
VLIDELLEIRRGFHGRGCASKAAARLAVNANLPGTGFRHVGKRSKWRDRKGDG